MKGETSGKPRRSGDFCASSLLHGRRLPRTQLNMRSGQKGYHLATRTMLEPRTMLKVTSRTRLNLLPNRYPLTSCSRKRASSPWNPDRLETSLSEDVCDGLRQTSPLKSHPTSQISIIIFRPSPSTFIEVFHLLVTLVSKSAVSVALVPVMT